MVSDNQAQPIVEKLASKGVSSAQKVFKSKSGIITLSAISFVEAALPIPVLTDPFLVAAILIERANTKRLVVAATISSVLGGIFAYLSAAYFFDFLLDWLSPDKVAAFNSLVESNLPNVFVLSLIGAITPVPYTIVAWVVAAIEGSLLLFIIASVIGRGFRYVVFGYTTYKFGPSASKYAKKYIGLTSVIVLLLGGLFLWLKM